IYIYANIYINFIKYCFNQRRKILVNRLLEISENEKINSNFFNTKNLNKKNIEIFFKTNNIKIDSRPENLSVENFYKLFEFMFDTSKFKN
ncbi:MAG: hypothetical protein LBF97_00310, partial [Elusimicrobiota bacterium]|nr:hypothetical protein [Elusimicrobiota bacterium]